VVLFNGCFLKRESNAGANFFSRKNGEAVPRPNASDGEHLSRGRLPPRAPYLSKNIPDVVHRAKSEWRAIASRWIE
jgi:hypothetical protein